MACAPWAAPGSWGAGPHPRVGQRACGMRRGPCSSDVSTSEQCRRRRPSRPSCADAGARDQAASHSSSACYAAARAVVHRVPTVYHPLHVCAATQPDTPPCATPLRPAPHGAGCFSSSGLGHRYMWLWRDALFPLSRVPALHPPDPASSPCRCCRPHCCSRGDRRPPTSDASGGARGGRPASGLARSGAGLTGDHPSPRASLRAGGDCGCHGSGA